MCTPMSVRPCADRIGLASVGIMFLEFGVKLKKCSESLEIPLD